MQIAILQYCLATVLVLTGDCFRFGAILQSRMMGKPIVRAKAQILSKIPIFMSDGEAAIPENAPESAPETAPENAVQSKNFTGHFTKRFLCLASCPYNRVDKHVQHWDDHIKWLKIAARYKPTRKAVVVEEHVMLDEDRTRPHAHLMFVDSDNAWDVMLYGLVDEPFASKRGTREWMHFDIEPIVPWKPREVLDRIFEHQAFVSRICNNQTNEESDNMLLKSAEYHRRNSEKVLYVAKIYPALYGIMKLKDAELLNLHRPVGELVMLRTNNRTEAIQYLRGNPLYETFSGHTQQHHPLSRNPYNMTVSAVSIC